MHTPSSPIGSAADIERVIGALSKVAFRTKEEKVSWVDEVLSTLRYDCLNRAEKGVVRLYLQGKTGYSRAQVARMILSFHRDVLMGGMTGSSLLRRLLFQHKGLVLLACALGTAIAVQGAIRP